MSSISVSRCHVAIISPCDDTASSVCHQLGRDYGDESFSGFEFRHNFQSDCELRCHLLHERCSEVVTEWPNSVDRLANLVSNFFDLDSSACPVIILAFSRQRSSELLLAQHIVPMICDNFSAVPIIAIQSEAVSSEPSNCLQALRLIQCLSFVGASIPPSLISVLLNLLNACSSSMPKSTLPSAKPQFFISAPLASSPTRVQSFSIPVSPVAPVHKQLLPSSVRGMFSTSPSGVDEALLSSTASPLSPAAISNAMLGLSLKWGAEGLIVQSVGADSFAGRSGCFHVGDVILNVDGIDVSSSRSFRHEAIARLRQACDAPVQVCTRAGPGWQGHCSRPIGSTTLFQLGGSVASFSSHPLPVPLIPANEVVASQNVDPNSLFAMARQFHLNGDSVAAAAHLLRAARRNHPPSCAMLASFYMNGCGGLPQNHQLAFSLARWSTLQKDPNGMGILACCFLFGLGTNQDFALAYTLAIGCVDESPHGQFGLGYMYLHGLGVDKDASLAARWIGLAARHGHIGAKLVLSNSMFEEQDPTKQAVTQVLTLMIGAASTEKV